MTEAAKINLSNKELELVCNSDWIFTKHIIINKVFKLFGNTLDNMQHFTNDQSAHLPKEIFTNPPKIYKGENYRLLPYVMLDYPRYFSKENALAIRTLFWWGNFFSVTLHVSGVFKQLLQPSFINAFSFLQQHDYWVCVNNTSWEHHFENDNYRQLKTMNLERFTAVVNGADFVKLAKKMPLQQWDIATQFIEQSFDEMLMLVQSHQAPSL